MLLADARAVVFDAVGTLIYPQPPAPVVYAQVGRAFGSRLCTEEIARRFACACDREADRDRRAGLRTSEAHERARWQRIVASVLDDVSEPEVCFQALFDHFARPEAWQCEPLVGATLHRLAAWGLILAVASNYDSRLRHVVEGLEALQPIQHLVISSEVGWRKPATGFFAAVCRTVGFTGPDVIYIGDDRANDYEGARAAGLGAILFDPHAKESTPMISRIRQLSDLAVPGARL